MVCTSSGNLRFETGQSVVDEFAEIREGCTRAEKCTVGGVGVEEGSDLKFRVPRGDVHQHQISRN